MKFPLISFFLLLSQFSFSQEIDCPVENGVIYYNESYDYENKYKIREINLCCKTQVYSEKPISVISVSEGKISGILTINNSLIVLVRKGNSDFYVYSNLNSSNFKKGDEIKIGDEIGMIDKKSEFSDYGDYVLDFQYWQKTEPIDVFDRLKRMKK